MAATSSKRHRTKRRFYREEAELVACVRDYYKLEKLSGTRHGVQNVTKRLVGTFGFSRGTIEKMCANPDAYPPAGQAETRLREPSYSSEVVALIHEIMVGMRNNEGTPTIRTVHARLKATLINGKTAYPWTFQTLHNHLKQIGYQQKKSKTYGEYIQERASVVLQRSRYLEVIAKYRAEKREIFYQDESWVSANTHSETQWWHEDMEPDTRAVRSGKGKRTLLCGVGSATSGWLNGRDSFLMFHGKHKVGTDYHEEMNSKVFLDWVEDKVAPHMPDGSVMVIDRATYHLVKTDDTKGPDGDNKAPLLAWLRAKQTRLVDSLGKDWTDRPDATIMKRPNASGTGGLPKPELQRLAKLNKPEPRYKVQDVLDAEGRDLKLLILPTHHPELNPIELQWGRMKTHVARHNTTCKLSDVERILLEEYDRILPEHWAGCEKKAKAWEEKWRESDDS
jgi:DDE superfamily endonuclease